MKNKGYVFSLMVFLIFLAVFIVLITQIKSVSILHDSAYDKTTIMKISNVARNIEAIKSDVPCNEIVSKLSTDYFKVSNTCGAATETITLTSKSEDYSYTITM